MEIKKVLITGGAGFIGSELASQLVHQGIKVLAVDNLINGRKENLDNLPDGLIELVVADIRDTERMRSLCKGINIIYHLACLGVRHSIHSPLENHEVNATATLKLLSIAKNVGVERFVYVSSSEVYGTAKRVPMTEEHPTLPMTVYGASKLAGECYARAFYRTYEYPTVVVRPFNVYGPRCHHEGDSGEVIPKFMLRCLAGLPMVIFGDGNQTRDFTYVSDAARGIMLAGVSENAIGETINLGSQGEITILELANKVASVVGRADVNIDHNAARPGDVLRLFADASKAHKMLGFEPEVALQDGLKKLMDWYLNTGKDPELLLKQEVIQNWNI